MGVGRVSGCYGVGREIMAPPPAKEVSSSSSYAKSSICKKPSLTTLLTADERELKASASITVDGSYTHPITIGNNSSAVHPHPKHFIRGRSDSSDDTFDDDWDVKERDDPVGDTITRMLNDGKVPHFGFSRELQNGNNTIVDAAAYVEESFKWSPLLSARNCRLLKRLISQAICNKSGKCINQRDIKSRGSMWFILESFCAIYVVVYSLNDIILRSTLEGVTFVFVGVISTIFVDVEEVQYGALSLFQTTPKPFQRLVLECIYLVWEFLRVVEKNYLWGHHFQGRTILWLDESRLIKFRRKHMRVMKVNEERKQNRRERRKARAERRRKEKKGVSFDTDDLEKIEEEIIVKEALNAAVEELKMKPPTFFPNQIEINREEVVASLRSDATKQHLYSLQYCHRMVFARQRGQDDMKPVTITTRRSNNLMSSFNNGLRQDTSFSPGEAIEIVNEFPDIGACNSASREQMSCSDSVSSSASKYSLVGRYDYSTDEDSVGDDSESQVSYASEKTVEKMDWLAVGAKIGHKILKSRRVQRVIANPEEVEKLLPEEAKKLIDGINKDKSKDEVYSSPTKASSWDSKGSAKLGDDTAINSLSQSKSIEGPSFKRPVHGMWTSPGSAATSSKTYGAATVVDSPKDNSAYRNGGRKLFASSETMKQPTILTTTDSIELQRESSNPELAENEARIENRLPHPLIRSMPSTHNKHSPYMPLEMIVSSTTITPRKSNTALSLQTNGIECVPEVTRLAPIEKGVKMVVPMFSPNVTNTLSGSCFLQMGTVLSSTRIFVPLSTSIQSHVRRSVMKETNCLAVKVVLDNAILRGSKFAEMSIRILDAWNYMPRHSKYPIGSCVATTFGVGILVGWRVEDDMHIIRSLWNRSGPGSGLAYLRRDSLNGVMEAAVGFEVETRMGGGKVLAYVRGGTKNTNGKYFVHLTSKGRYKGRVMEFSRPQILSCRGATFTPVTEHVRAAALYQLEILHYKAKMREHMVTGPSNGIRNKGMWRNFSEYVDLFAASLSKAIAEDPDFDREMDKFISHVLNMIDGKKDSDDALVISRDAASSLDGHSITLPNPSGDKKEMQPWSINDLFGCFFIDDAKAIGDTSFSDYETVESHMQAFEEAHNSGIIMVRVLLRTIAVARASVPNRPKLHIALAMIHEALLFLRQILRVQKANMSKQLIEAWFRTINEVSATFGPLKDRTTLLGQKMAEKLKKHGDVAKRRILRFVDIVLGDTQLLNALEMGDWRMALLRFESAIVKANITDAETCEQLHKGVVLMVSCFIIH